MCGCLDRANLLIFHHCADPTKIGDGGDAIRTSLNDNKTKRVARFGQTFAAYFGQDLVDFGKGLFGAGVCLAQDGLARFAMYARALAAADEVRRGQHNCPHLMTRWQGRQTVSKRIADLAGMALGMLRLL